MECKKTICEICSDNCGIDAWVDNGKVVRVEGSKECKNRGQLCVKGYASRDYLYRSDRLRTPLKRTGPRGSGEFKPISWDEAYREIAARLNDYKIQFGADSVFFFAGYSKWYRTLFHRFAHSFGTLNYGTESSTCFQAMRLACLFNAGHLRRAAMNHTALFVGWGYNPFHSRVFHLKDLERRRKKGMKILCIDPKQTPFAQMADLHLQVRAGSDGALALFFGNYLIEHGAIDIDYIAAHVHGFETYREYVQTFSLERTARITGEAPDKILAAAGMLADAPTFAISQGAAPLTHHTNGVQNFRAILALSAITGNYDRVGGNIPTEYASPDLAPVCDVRDEAFIQEVRPESVRPKVGSERFPVWSELIDEAQACDLARQVLEGTPYPIKAIFALGMNARMFAGNERMLRALEHIDFFVDVDLFQTETSKYADIVLPACTSFERSQFQGGFHGHYLTGNKVRYTAPVIEPLYESKSDADILCELAEYLDLPDPLLRAGHDACSKDLLRTTDISWEALLASPMDLTMEGKTPYSPGSNTRTGYATPTGKFELASEVLRRHGYDPLPTWREPLDDADPARFPLQLVAGGRLPFEFHSRFQKSALKGLFRPSSMADIHPDDAAALEIRHLAPICLTTAWGSVRVLANVTYTVKPGSVFIYQDYPDADINRIIGADHLDPISGFPGFRSLRCRLEKEVLHD